MSREAILRKRASRIEAKTGPPEYSTDQRMRVLEILRGAGERGVYRELFLIPVDLGGYGITQVSTRINELRKQGCVIDSRRVRPEHTFVTYFLPFVPERLKDLPQDKPRLVSDHQRRTRELEDTALPLFAQVQR